MFIHALSPYNAQVHVAFAFVFRSNLMCFCVQVELDGPEDLRNFRLLPLELNDDWEAVEDEDFDFSRVEAWDPDF